MHGVSFQTKPFCRIGRRVTAMKQELLKGCSSQSQLRGVSAVRAHDDMTASVLKSVQTLRTLRRFEVRKVTSATVVTIHEGRKTLQGGKISVRAGRMQGPSFSEEEARCPSRCSQQTMKGMLVILRASQSAKRLSAAEKVMLL